MVDCNTLNIGTPGGTLNYTNILLGLIGVGIGLYVLFPDMFKKEQ
jgi:hypothetical protein